MALADSQPDAQLLGNTVSLKDKIAIVTGAASGIGREIARQFLAHGAKVAIADIDIDAARAAAAELDPNGDKALGVAMDVTQEAQVDAGVDEVAWRFGGIDILVSNAGVQIVSPLEDFAFGVW